MVFFHVSNPEPSTEVSRDAIILFGRRDAKTIVFLLPPLHIPYRHVPEARPAALTDWFL